MAGLFDYEFQLEKINTHNPPLQKLDADNKPDFVFMDAFSDLLQVAVHERCNFCYYHCSD